MIELLTADHRAVDDAFKQLEAMTPDAADRGPLAEHIVTELVRHAVAEEQYLYPAVRDVLADGDSLADHHLQEHAEAEQLMMRLEQAEPASDQFTSSRRRWHQQSSITWKTKKNDLFPKLRGACSPPALQEMGTQVQQAKDAAPTRPHPSAPDKPPLNKILAPGTALVDRARDALITKPTEARIYTIDRISLMTAQMNPRPSMTARVRGDSLYESPGTNIWVGEQASALCADAADHAARCAADELAQPETATNADIADLCLVATRVLGACTDLLRCPVHHTALAHTTALARLAADVAHDCARNLRSRQPGKEDWQQCAAACEHAATALDTMLKQLSPSGNRR